ncbi:YdcF family protein, partial [Sutcliffiella cohnii]|uniref:YdcF family protein n=1 Tax=Sutcliffiella cohnii TaxID=33932 RepID=UPI002E1EC116|nr:YdcF family protein [Sutcliffiella cohnii]
MGIPKYPDVPNLTQKQMDDITEIVFYKEVEPKKCDVIFVFGGSHPGNWMTPLDAYQKGLGDLVIVTGGGSLSNMRHPEWNYGTMTEAEIIVKNLIGNGVPNEAINYETSSMHSIANVIEAKKIFDFTTINSLLFVCKSTATGRQYRTLTKHLPSNIELIPYPFDTSFDGQTTITRDNWMDIET